MATAAAGAPARERGRLPLVTYLLTAGTFLMGTSEFLVAGLLPDIGRDLGVGVAQAGLTITVFAVGMIVGTPTMVLLTLRLSRRTTLSVALLIFALGHVAAALSGDLTVLLAARFLTAVATGAFWAVASLVASDTAGPGAGARGVAVVGSGGMLANVIGVPLGSVAGHLLGWRGPFWVLAVLAAIAAVAVARLVPAEAGTRSTPSIRAEVAALRSLPLWIVLLTCALVSGGVLSVFSFISPLLTERTGLPESDVPLALLLFGIAALAGTLLGGRFGDRRPATTVLVCAAVSFVAIAALGLLSTAPVPTFALFTLLGLTGLSANPILFGAVVRLGGAAPTLASALVPSAFNTGTAIGTGITAAALGTGLGAASPAVVGTVSAALVLVVYGALTTARRRERGTGA
jgi:DHA1 family inner membrane transport protein